LRQNRQAVTRTANFILRLVRCWRWLTFSCVPEYKKPPLLVRDEDIPSRIHQNILGLIHKRPYGDRSNTLCRSGRNKPTGFCRQVRIFDIEDPKPRIEVCRIDQIAGLFHIGQMVFKVGIVWAESSTLAAEVAVRSILWRGRSREYGYQPGLRQILHIDQT